jgi:hypothetical protein
MKTTTSDITTPEAATQPGSYINPQAQQEPRHSSGVCTFAALQHFANLDVHYTNATV